MEPSFSRPSALVGYPAAAGLPVVDTFFWTPSCRYIFLAAPPDGHLNKTVAFWSVGAIRLAGHALTTHACDHYSDLIRRP
jgi:hypothetical protein